MTSPESNEDRKRNSTVAGRLPDEVIEYFGAIIQKYDRFVSIETSRTEEQQQQVRAHLVEAAANRRTQLERNAQELQKLLSKYDPFDIIAHFMILCQGLPLGNQEEVAFPTIPPFFPEYLALQSLKHPMPRDGQLLDDFRLLAHIEDLLREIMEALPWLELEKSDPTKMDPHNQDLAYLSYVTRLHEMGVRGKAFSWQLDEVSNMLYSPFSKDLRESLGFCPADAIALVRAVGQFSMERLSERLAQAQAEIKADVDTLRNRIEEAIALRGRNLTEEESEVTSRLSNRQVRERSAQLAQAWVFFGVGETLSFTPEELAKCAGTGVAEATSFLHSLSSQVGTLPTLPNVPDSVNILWRSPFITDGRRFLCPSWGLLMPAVHFVFEDTLKKNDARWNRYAGHRHDSVLEKSLELMSGMMPGSVSAAHLKYQVLTDGKAKECELDGLILDGSVLFLIEAKGRTLSDDGRRGFSGRLSTEIKDLVGRAHEQAVRALRTIQDSQEAHFVCPNGQNLVIKGGDITSAFLITVSLDPISFITSNIIAETTIKSFKEDLRHFPWMVSLYELMTIAEIIDDPFILPHYIKGRTRVGSESLVQAFDEMDVFGHYLFEGLCFSQEDEPDRAIIQIMTYTDPIDKYLYYVHGARSEKANRPRPSFALTLRPLLRELSHSKMPHKTEVAMAILDLHPEEQKEFAQQLERCYRQLRKHRRPKSFMYYFKPYGGWGLSCIAVPKRAQSELTAYCMKKRRQYQAAAWYGLGRSVSEKGLVAFCTRTKPRAG